MVAHLGAKLGTRALARFAALWLSPYFRGALSGLGLLNIYIAVAETLKQLKSLFGQERS